MFVIHDALANLLLSFSIIISLFNRIILLLNLTILLPYTEDGVPNHSPLFQADYFLTLAFLFLCLKIYEEAFQTKPVHQVSSCTSTFLHICKPFLKDKFPDIWHEFLKNRKMKRNLVHIWDNILLNFVYGLKRKCYST